MELDLGFMHRSHLALGLALVALGSAASAQQPLFTFAQVSDSQPQTASENQNFVDVLRTLAQAGTPGSLLPYPVDLVLFAGDITWGNTRAEWVAAKQKLDTWLTANDIPFLAVPGNHDVNNSDTNLYREFIGSSGVWDAGSAVFTGQNGITRTTTWAGLRFIGVNNSNPGWNTIASADVADVAARVTAAAAAQENVFILCHHPHDEKSRVPLANVLPNPSAVGYLHGHILGPEIHRGLAGINNPNLWDFNTNAVYRDRCLVYFEVFPNELRAHLLVLDNNPSSLPAPFIVPLVHPLTTTGGSNLGLAGALHANSRTDATGRSPERKLWFAAGSWWGVLWSDTDAAWRIQRLNESNQTWTNTGPSLGTDATLSFDALAEGSNLFLSSNVVSSTGAAGNGSPGQLTRFHYDSGLARYASDAGFPVAVNDWRARTLVIERDGAGLLWAAWVQSGQVLLSHSLASDASWSTPLTLASGLGGTDTVALRAFGGALGALWTNANSGALNFARHADGAADTSWSSEIAAGTGVVSGSALELSGADGRVFAVLGAPNGAMNLFERSTGGNWSVHPLAASVDGLHDGLLLVDRARNLLRFFATGPTSAGQSLAGGGALYQKVAPLANPDFPPGRGTVVIEDPGHPSAGFASSTRQDVNLTSGLALLASVSQTERYWHHRDSLAVAPLAPSAAFSAGARSGPAPLVVDFSDLSTNAPTWWSWDFGDGASSSERNPRHVYSAPGSYTVGLRVASGGGQDVLTRSAYVTVDGTPSGGLVFRPVADARVNQASASSNAGKDVSLRVKSQSGTSYRSFLRFDLGTLSGPVASAKLRLWCTDESNSGGSVYRITDNSWSETGITWNNQPALPSSTLAVMGSVGLNQWAEIELGAGAVSNGQVSLALAGGSTNSALYSSREGAHPPELVLTYAGAGSPPVASFTGTPLSGPAPLTVSFTDTSSGAPNQWAWDFGDATGSSARNPSHTYDTPGVYSVVLDASNANGLDSLQRLDYVVVTAALPTRTFLAVADARVDQGNVTRNYGTETSLRLRSSSGSSQESYLRFDLSSLSGSVLSAKLRLYCTDAGPDGGRLFPVSASWNESSLTWANRPALPAGSLGTLGSVAVNTWKEIDVSSAVTGPGAVAFALTEGTSNTVLYSSREGAHPPELVVETGSALPPSANFSAAPTSGAAPLTVSFSDLSSGASAWSWDFGDGTSSSARNPTHVYAVAGSYSVRLQVSGALGSDALLRSDLVQVSAGSPVRTFLPIADARANEASPTSKAGSDPVLRVRESPGGSYHSYLRFDLSTLPANVLSARLRLFSSDGSNVAGLVYPTSGSWSEANLNWATEPGPNGQVIASVGTVATGAWAEFDVTAALGGPGLAGGFLNLEITSSSTNSCYYSSREGTNPPELIVTTAGP